MSEARYKIGDKVMYFTGDNFFTREIEKIAEHQDGFHYFVESERWIPETNVMYKINKD